MVVDIRVVIIETAHVVVMVGASRRKGMQRVSNMILMVR